MRIGTKISFKPKSITATKMHSILGRFFHLCSKVSRGISARGVRPLENFNVPSVPLASSFLSIGIKHKPLLMPQIHPASFSTTIQTFFRPVFEDFEFQHLRGKIKKYRPNKNPLGKGIPKAGGVVIRPIIKKPKKPNSANRKCVLVRLKSGKELTAFVPGEGHNLQEHSTVLIKVGRLRDTPGVKVRCIRGHYDLPKVVKAAK